MTLSFSGHTVIVTGAGGGLGRASVSVTFMSTMLN
jgi:NAD(P)-dependent dehydrogenase (short-subunit alcohol dehydrogenase family)